MISTERREISEGMKEIETMSQQLNLNSKILL